MPGFFDGRELEITCQQCRRTFKKTVRDLKRAVVKCPNCDAGFETSQLKREIDKADRSIQDFQRSLKDIKINIRL